MDILNILLILITGTAAGFINSVAGGGSLLSLPLLITLGYPSAVANGTNRIAIIIQDIIAVANFKKKGYSNFKMSFKLGLPAIIGAIIGSNIAITVPDSVFNTVLAIVMVLMLIIIIFNPQKKLMKNKNVKNMDHSFNKVLGYIIFFFIGLYGGFIQAGVGFLIITALAFLTGSDLVKISSIKVFIVAMYLIPSLLIFIINGKIELITGLILATGNGLGAWIGTSLAVKNGEKMVKAVIFIAIIFMAGNLLGVY